MDVDLPAAETPKPPDDRHRHPFHMHEMMRRQPIAARTTLTAVRGLPLPKLPAEGRVLFTGIGTSFHAALALARGATSADPAALHHAVAVPAFELRNDPPGLGDLRLAVVLSASGQTDVTRRATERLRARGVPILLITAAEKGPIAELADSVVVTQYADERSWTHTVSYSAAVVAGLAIQAAWKGDDPAEAALLDTVPDALTSALAVENALVDVAERLADRTRWVLLGSGPRSVTIREGALKLREAAGRFVTTLGVEEFLHGSLSSVDDTCVVVALTGTRLESARAKEGLGAAQELGAETLHFDSTPGATGPEAWTTQPLEGAYSVLPDVVPFQLLAYWMAVSTGRNPDMMGYDDPRHLRARSRFGL